MKKRGLISTVLAAILVIALAVTLIVTYLTLKYYVVVNWQLFPKHREVLDIRKQAITCAEYDSLAWKMPDTRIIWSVPFQDGYVSSDTKELTVKHLSARDLDVVPYLQNLQTVNANGCRDYAELAAMTSRFPEVDVQYTVAIGGDEISSDSTTVVLSSLLQTEVAQLSYLPKLTTVDGRKCSDIALMAKLKETHPEWNVLYTSELAGQPLNVSATTLELNGAEYEELAFGLAAMPDLKSVMLHSPKADGESLLKLREEYPDMDIHWDLEIFGQTFRDDATEIDISSQPVGSIEVAKEIAAKFPKLTKLIVDSRGIENEDMAQYREEVRSQYKVVWTVYMGSVCKARTDETTFMPIKQGEWYFNEDNAYNLRYCEDMVCIDVGHAPIHTVDFAAYMPHLKYLILADTQVKSPDALVNCKELIYLEVDHSAVINLEPIKGCTALQDININECYAPIEPLLEMPWLKTLWVTNKDRGYSQKMALVNGLPDTRVVTTEISSATGLGWRNLQNYYDMRDMLGMPYMA